MAMRRYHGRTRRITSGCLGLPLLGVGPCFRFGNGAADSAGNGDHDD